MNSEWVSKKIIIYLSVSLIRFDYDTRHWNKAIKCSEMSNRHYNSKFQIKNKRPPHDRFKINLNRHRPIPSTYSKLQLKISIIKQLSGIKSRLSKNLKRLTNYFKLTLIYRCLFPWIFLLFNGIDHILILIYICE